MAILDSLPAPFRAGLLAVLAAAVAGAVVALLSLGRPKLTNGWVMLRPSALLYLLGAVSVPLAAMMLSFGVLGMVDPFPDVGPHPRLVAAGEALLGLTFPYAAVIAFCVRFRFNDTGVEKSWFGRARFVSWVDIERLNRAFFLGPQLVTKAGRRVLVSEYFVGFPDLVAMAVSKGVAVAEEFLQV